MSTQNLIQTNTEQLEAARQALALINKGWELAARSGEDCSALEEKQDDTARAIRRLELRGEALDEQLRDEQAAAHAAKLEADHAEMSETLEKLATDGAKLAKEAETLANAAHAHGQEKAQLIERLRLHAADGGRPLAGAMVLALTQSPLPRAAVSERLNLANLYNLELEEVHFRTGGAA